MGQCAHRPSSTPLSEKEMKRLSEDQRHDLKITQNEIPCMFFAWLVYDLKLYNNLTGTVYSADTGHELLKGFGSWSILTEYYKDTKQEIIHAIIAVCEERKEAIVAFRGTQSTFSENHRSTTMNDWVYGCFDAHLVSWNRTIQDCGSVHHGFFKHFQSISKEIPKQLKECVYAGYTVTFTGHSQGGALAVYSSLEVAEVCPVVRKNIYLITFGSPKCGNKKFVCNDIQIIQ
jgi:predicted lipase